MESRNQGGSEGAFCPLFVPASHPKGRGASFSRNSLFTLLFTVAQALFVADARPHGWNGEEETQRKVGLSPRPTERLR